MSRLFNSKKINDYFRSNTATAIQRLIDSTSFETVDADTTADEIASYYLINLPSIEVSKTQSSLEMEENKQGHMVAVVTYSIPYRGKREFFEYSPTNAPILNYLAYTEHGYLKFKIDSDYGNINLTEEIKQAVKNKAVEAMNFITSTLELLNVECLQYNKDLKTMLKDEIIKRQDDIKKSKKLSDELNPFK